MSRPIVILNIQTYGGSGDLTFMEKVSRVAFQTGYYPFLHSASRMDALKAAHLLPRHFQLAYDSPVYRAHLYLYGPTLNAETAWRIAVEKRAPAYLFLEYSVQGSLPDLLLERNVILTGPAPYEKGIFLDPPSDIGPLPQAIDPAIPPHYFFCYNVDRSSLSRFLLLIAEMHPEGVLHVVAPGGAYLEKSDVEQALLEIADTAPHIDLTARYSGGSYALDPAPNQGKGGRRQAVLYLFHLSRPQFLSALQGAQNPVGITGDQSLSEALSLGKYPLYECLPHKRRLLSNLIDFAATRQLHQAAYFFQLQSPSLQIAPLIGAMRHPDFDPQFRAFAAALRREKRLEEEIQRLFTQFGPYE
jgi:hypothetical protein